MRVLAIDNFITGSRDNLRDLDGNPDFEFKQADVNHGIFIGGDVRYVLAFTAWGLRVPTAVIMVLVPGLGAPFAWLGAVAEYWTRAALVFRRFQQGRWKTMRV